MADYRVYVSEQVDATLAGTRRFAAAVSEGDVADAKEPLDEVNALGEPLSKLAGAVAR